jgi:hypothetical protein
MFLSDALSVIGVFLLGAASGGCVKYARYRGLVALCKQLTETSSLHATDGMLMAGHCAQCVVNRGVHGSVAVRDRSVAAVNSRMTKESKISTYSPSTRVPVTALQCESVTHGESLAVPRALHGKRLFR